jgi:iron complex outermembrane recepter protein
MRKNRELALAVRRALEIGTLALCGAGGLAAYAQQAAPTQATETHATAATAQTTSAKAGAANEPIVLAQANNSANKTQVSDNPADNSQLETVVVTGSMIARPAAETAQPVTIVQATALKQLGIVNVEQALSQISANVSSRFNIASSVGNFNGGVSFANLRDLGAQRTLVLLDGQRLASNAVTGDAIDLNGIPFSAIQKIEVLRDGASSLYGSDAIAGVINFITRKDYQGGEIEANYNRPQEPGGGSGYINFSLGHGSLVDDGYNVMITGSYSKQNEVIATQRAFSATGVDPARGLLDTNNPGSFPASVQDKNGNLWQYGYPACAGNPFLTRLLGNCAYEYAAATDLIPKSDEASGLLSISKSLPANNTLSFQYLYTRSTVKSWTGPTFYDFPMDPKVDTTYFPAAAQLTCAGGPANCNAAPDLTDPINAIWTDPNNNRFTGNINTEQRVVLTFSGKNGGWDYSATLNYSQNENSQQSDGGNPNEAVLSPNGILSDLINPFGPLSAAGQNLVNSSYLNGTYVNGKLKRWSTSVNASHELIEVFHAGNPAVLALGVNAEGSSYDQATTPLAVPLQAATAFAPITVHGSRQLQAVFAELDVPMSTHLDVDVSDREDRYSDFGNTNNWKVSLRYQPLQYLTFRGSASTGFRAPSLVDLFLPNNIGAIGGSIGQGGNPFCTPATYNTEFTPAVCQSQGLGLFGGNRNLKPETSQNYNIGFVVEPVTDLGITVDYYRVLLKNAINTIPGTAIYGDPTTFAHNYVLNQAGTLTQSIALGLDCTPFTAPTCGYILQTRQNTGGITTNGVDLSVQYAQHTPLGVFREDLEGTAITQYRLQQFTGGPVLNLVGWYNKGNQPALRWQHILRVDWTSPDSRWGAGLDNRLLSSYIDQFPDGAGNPRTVGTQSIWDTYTSFKPLESLTVLFGIRNLLNTDPPFSNSTYNFTAGYSSVFSDPIGRTFYLNVKYQFL